MLRLLESHYLHALKSAKSSYYTDLVKSNASDQSQLFRTLNNVMHMVKKNPLPDCNNAQQLANDFNNLFHEKVDKIRTSFSDNNELAFQFEGAIDTD